MGKSQSKPTVSNFNRFFYLQDSDQVYERQWRLSNLSVTAIKDYLAKIKRRSLVLKECTKTVPPGNYEKTVMLNLLPKKEYKCHWSIYPSIISSVSLLLESKTIIVFEFYECTKAQNP